MEVDTEEKVDRHQDFMVRVLCDLSKGLTTILFSSALAQHIDGGRNWPLDLRRY